VVDWHGCVMLRCVAGAACYSGYIGMLWYRQWYGCLYPGALNMYGGISPGYTDSLLRVVVHGDIGISPWSPGCSWRRGRTGPWCVPLTFLSGVFNIGNPAFTPGSDRRLSVIYTVELRVRRTSDE
jgi:hypothetical protein